MSKENNFENPTFEELQERINSERKELQKRANNNAEILKVLFDNDKSIVKPQYYDEVKRVADFMTRHPEVTATLEGHTDSNASADYNFALSQLQVDAIKQILIQNYNIDASRLNSIGYGESHPIADNATAEGRQRNRRVIAVFKTN